MMMRLYKALFKLSRKKVKQKHMDKHHCDIRCPNCNEWFSISGLDYKHEEVSKPDFGYHVKCGKCRYESYWNAVAAPVLLVCDKKGTPT